MKRTFLIALYLIAHFVLAATGAWAVEYQIQDLGMLNGKPTYAQSINQNGMVVGYSYDRSVFAYRAFVWQNGQMQDIGTLGGSQAAAYGVNSKGEVVGYSTTDSGQEHIFLWRDGTMHDLGSLGGSESRAYSINDSSQVVGYSATSGFSYHAFTWQGGLIRIRE